MPNLLDIRRRIRTVKNTQQITKAMKMVSAAKLRRAQEQATAARPYAQKLERLLRDVVSFVDLGGVDATTAAGVPVAALLAQRPVRRVLLVAISSDSGLAGAFNANVFKVIAGFLEERAGVEVELELVGRKARDYYRNRPTPVADEHLNAFGKKVNYAVAQSITETAMRRYAAGEVDEVFVVGNEFRSILNQRVELRRVLPVAVPEAATADSGRDYIFDAPPAELLAELLPRSIQTQVYRALLESFAAEHAARMNAMEAATKNAAELIDTLTLNMNRIRQAAITKEIIEIVSGAAALEG